MPWWIFRSVAAAVAALAIMAGVVVVVDRAGRQHESVVAVLANYFSYFTIVSGVVATIALTLAAAQTRRATASMSRGLAVAMATASTSIIVLGIVYNVLLRADYRGVPSDPAVIVVLDRFAIEALHIALPLYMAADLLLGPVTRRLSWRALVVIIGYPLLWTAYTMIRGELVPSPDGSTPWWYPYPFLDPHGPGGYPSVFAYIGGVAVAFLAVGALVVVVTRMRAESVGAKSGADAVP